MHILIALLTAAAGLAWGLYRLQHSGVDLNSFNPFYWLRRRKWQRQLGTKPIHRLERPMDAAAVLVVGMAKLEGDLSREHKAEIIELFIREFQVSREVAVELFAASTHLLQDVANLTAEVHHILAPTRGQFKQEQVSSLLRMLRQAATAEGPASPAQLTLLDTVTPQLEIKLDPARKW